MQLLFGSDLDDTLIFALNPQHTHLNLVIVDAPERYGPFVMTVEAARMLTDLNHAGVFMPITARATPTYQRIRLPGGTPRYAASAAGGVLLVDGRPDKDWEEHQHHLSRLTAPIDHMVNLLARCPGLSRPRHIEGAYAIANIHDPHLYAAGAQDLLDAVTAHQWRASTQHGKVHLYPAHLTKEAVLLEVAARTGATHTITAGDSLMDAGLISVSNLGMRPSAGELHDTNWHHPNVTVIPATGPLAGEDIVRRAHATLDTKS